MKLLRIWRLRLSACLTAIALAAFLTGNILANGAAPPAPFETGDSLYDRGDYTGALAEYRKLDTPGARTSNLYFNMGNAEYRLGSPGEAILNYERSLSVSPNHPEAQANIKLARGQAGSRLLEAGPLQRLMPALPGDAYLWIASVAGWVAIFCIVILIAWPRLSRPLLGLVLVTALGVFVASGIGVWIRSQERDMAIVIPKEAIARLAPADLAAIAETLPAGSQVLVLSERDAWIYCELPGHIRGWLSSGAIEKVHTRG